MRIMTFGCLIGWLLIGIQATTKPPMQGPEVRRVCVESLDIRVGESFDKVEKVIHLNPDPNGPNRNSSWAAGKYSDFYSTEGPTYSFDKGGPTLRSMVYCTFDGRRRLRSLTLSWTYDGDKTTATKNLVLTTLQNKIHTCLSKQVFREINGRQVARIDFGTYSQELVFDSTRPETWVITYTISEEP